MVFPVVRYGWVSWTIKKAERRRIDAFELWCWRKLLRVPWTTRRSNQGDHSWVFTGGTDAEAQTPILWLPDAESALIWKKNLMLGKIEGRRRRGWQRIGWLDGITDSMDMSMGDRSHEIKRHLLLGRKVMTNLDSILKSRDITFPTKVRLVRLWFLQWSCTDVRVGF